MDDRSAPPAIVGTDVALGYDGRTVFAPSSFHMPRGALTAVIGPNGSGKSTLLSAVAGLLEPRAGSIEVLGGSPRRHHHDTAYVLQSTKVNDVMPVTVSEAVAMGRYARLGPFRRFGRRDREACDTAMEQLNLTRIAGKHLTELSGGQRQRVFVAQGLAQEALVLLLDEPLTGFDIISKELIARAVTSELRRGSTVVIATHDLADAATADHVLLVSGRVVAGGPPADALDPDHLVEAYGVGILHLEDGSVALDDPAHGGRERHVHFDRSGHDHTPTGEGA